MSVFDVPDHYEQLKAQYDALRRDHQRYLKKASQIKMAHEKAARGLEKIADPAKKEAGRLMQIAQDSPGEMEAELLERRWRDFPSLENILGESD